MAAAVAAAARREGSTSGQSGSSGLGVSPARWNCASAFFSYSMKRTQTGFDPKGVQSPHQRVKTEPGSGVAVTVYVTPKSVGILHEAVHENVCASGLSATAVTRPGAPPTEPVR